MTTTSAVQSFRDLLVWQKSIDLVVIVYRLTRNFPREECYGLTAQMRRTAVSIPSNIAEGQGRLSTGEFRQFLGIARGSNCELQTQLEIARKLGFGNTEDLGSAEKMSREIGKMTYAILEKTRPRISRTPTNGH